MPSTRCISKPSTRHVGAGVLAFLFALITALTFVSPAAKAHAADDGGTTLGIIIIDSKGQASPGSTTLGIRITNSDKLIETTYDVTLNPQGGSGGDTSVKVTYNLSLSKVTPPSRTGYTFVGYFDEANTKYYNSTGDGLRLWDKTAKEPLFAHWTANKYTVSFDSKGGTGGQTAAVEATYDAPMPAISTTPPSRPGYTFAGWYDAEKDGNLYYDANGVSKVNWDKATNTTLYAHWTLILDFTFPSDALVQIDATGNVTGQENFTFSSGTVKPLKITAVKGTPTSSAAFLFAQGTIPDGLRILLTPKVSSGEEVKVPLNSADTSISNGGWTLAAGSTSNPTKFAVAFSLFLPSGTQLNYFPNGDVSIANLSYVVEAADAS